MPVPALGGGTAHETKKYMNRYLMHNPSWVFYKVLVFLCPHNVEVIQEMNWEPLIFSIKRFS